jgi:F-type H+-transporting ATPase subunit alpha
VRAESEDLLAKLREGDWSDELQDRLRDVLQNFADDFGYDLDEEGQPIEDRDVGETTREQEGIRRRGEDGDGDDDGERERGDEGEGTEEQEEAAAPA